MSVRKAFWLALVVATVGCAGARNKYQSVSVSDGVIMPASMCAKRGVAARSKDEPGSGMVCEREELVGSHFPRCICRDEQQVIADRERAQQDARDAESKSPYRGN